MSAIEVLGMLTEGGNLERILAVLLIPEQTGLKDGQDSREELMREFPAEWAAEALDGFFLRSPHSGWALMAMVGSLAQTARMTRPNGKAPIPAPAGA